MAVLNLMFEKITNLSAFSIKTANIGKILNIISGDINGLEYNLLLPFFIAPVPFSLIFCIAILCVRHLSYIIIFYSKDLGQLD